MVRIEWNNLESLTMARPLYVGPIKTVIKKVVQDICWNLDLSQSDQDPGSNKRAGHTLP